ncbi:hypothetical protein CEXT_733751 [Caerostris extrusa]|uniref:Uncharacterized protein n=1 Tax=Caerostris extrusa TaxID=172846 RepID=A0AAV4SRI5_CAEEX|nr:hypothetical protein CEXT_733751 [Caerostris extrusa]
MWKTKKRKNILFQTSQISPERAEVPRDVPGHIPGALEKPRAWNSGMFNASPKREDGRNKNNKYGKPKKKEPNGEKSPGGGKSKQKNNKRVDKCGKLRKEKIFLSKPHKFLQRAEVPRDVPGHIPGALEKPRAWNSGMFNASPV